jgi:hypothetical protein
MTRARRLGWRSHSRASTKAFRSWAAALSCEARHRVTKLLQMLHPSLFNLQRKAEQPECSITAPTPRAAAASRTLSTQRLPLTASTPNHLQATCYTSPVESIWGRATAAGTGGPSCLFSERASARARRPRCLCRPRHPFVHR